VRNHQWDKGLAEIQSVLQSEPRNTKALNLAGLALIGKGEIEQANEYFRKCLRVNPGFAPALKNLSIDEFNARQYSSAEKHLLTAWKLAPDDPVVSIYLGEISYKEQKYKNATVQFGRARELVSRNPNASADLAISYLQTDERQKALEIIENLHPEGMEPHTQFELAVALDQTGMSERAIPYLQVIRQQFPDSYEIGFDLMLIELAAKHYTQAIDTGNDLIARGHETSELNNILGEAFADNHEPGRALDAYRRAITLNPADEENYLDLASLCIDQRSLQSGMIVVQAGLGSHPKSERLLFMRGLLYALQDEYELAEKDFRLSTELAPEKNLGAIGLGASYIETGHDGQAIEVLHQRLRENPNDASLLYLLGEALIRSGATPGSAGYSEAESAVEKSTRLNPDLCLPHISLGSIYLDEDRNKEAAEQFEQARAIDPSERSAYSHLAVAYRRLGEQDKSRQVLAALKDLIQEERQSTHEKMKSAAARSAEQQGGEGRTPDTMH